MHTKRLLLPLMLFATPVAAEECLTIGYPSGAGAGVETMDIVGKTLARVGMCTTPLRAPGNRLPEMQLDGEAAALMEPDPRFIAVPTPITIFNGTVYWHPGRPEPGGPRANIGIVLGQEWARHAALGLGTAPFEVRDNKQLFEMMATGRLNGIIVPAETYKHFLGRYPSLKQLQSRHLADVPVRLMLDRRFEKDIPELDRALIALRQQGYVDQVMKKYAQ